MALQQMKDGYYDGSGLLSIQMRSADMLKIGKLILKNGAWADERIVPLFISYSRSYTSKCDNSL
jgi:hypothetical protein